MGRPEDDAGRGLAPDARIGPALGRQHALDGLRGLAALAVAIAHCNLAVTGTDVWAARLRDFHDLPVASLAGRLFYVVSPGDAAVTLFFVLSGYVLWSAFARHGTTTLADLPDYTLRRAYRLMPVAIVSAIPIGFVVNASAFDLARTMLLLTNDLNGVLWTLQVEVVGSFPIFLVRIMVGESRAGLVGSVLVALALSYPLRAFSSALFLPAFLLGALVSASPARWWTSRALLGASVSGLALASLLFSHSVRARYVEMAAAAAVIACTLVRPLAALKAPQVQFLGAVSYPFYLTHGTTLLAAQHLGLVTGIGNAAGRIVAYVLLTVPVALAAAWLLHVLIEAPAMRFRPRLGTARIQGKPGAARSAAGQARP
ncbi:acyltransferase family protein [uncultured Enterovirga sp.]|uniref:acyltransferase family protein n=1 Tax=uncultured Enterovirga sp. TaxID=2026352 RepID=UPI0035CBC4EA